jgi:hypothetical protein
MLAMVVLTLVCFICCYCLGHEFKIQSAYLADFKQQLIDMQQ